MLSGNVLHRPPCGLVDLQYGTKVGGSNRRGLGINRSTQFGHLLSVRARICLQLQHISRSATAPAKRIPGPHTRPNDLRDGAVAKELLRKKKKKRGLFRANYSSSVPREQKKISPHETISVRGSASITPSANIQKFLHKKLLEIAVSRLLTRAKMPVFIEN
jgi:hypothetical protein